jgi:hypothetical protein
MRYLKKIVERTLKIDKSGSLKPAITPDSIPEPFEIRALAGTPAVRSITESSSNGSAKKQQPADAPRPTPDQKAAGKEERLPEQFMGPAAAAATLSPTKQVTQATPQKKAASPDPEMMPGNAQAEADVPTEKEKKPDHNFVAAAPVVLHAATEVGRADAASQTKPLEPSGRPATSGADDKYHLAETQPDEPTVTINIGRIEVRAISPVVEERSLPRKEYSPPLSLDEYLKQRMEAGKKK